MSDFGEWLKSVPFLTRYWFSSTIVCTLLGRFGLVKPQQLVLYLAPLKRFQIWRLLTCVLYYPIEQAGFHYLINLYFLYNYSRRLEEGKLTNNRSNTRY